MDLPDSPLDLLRATGSRLAVVYSTEHGVPLVYGIHRVRLAQLMRMAVGALAAARAKVEADQEILIGVAGAPTPEAKEAARRKLEDAQAENERRLMAELTGSPERMSEVIAGSADLVKASVRAVGFGLPGIEPGLHPADTQPGDICQPLKTSPDTGEAIYLEPLRWGDGQADADTVSLGDIPDLEIAALAACISEAFMPREAASFRGERGGRGSAADRGPVGEAVRPAPEPAVQPGSRKRAARSRGDGGGR